MGYRWALAVSFVALSANGALGINSAYAQEGAATRSDAIEEIIVTAQKRAENAQDVPIAVTAVSGDTLAQTRVGDAFDLKSVAPSLNYSTAVGGIGLPRIRGVGSTGQGPGIENPVATYIDGVYLAASTGVIASLADVEQVAVLKGPQGTLFGRNATGGLIQITTKAPSFTPTGFVEAGYANYDTVSVGGYVSAPLTNDIAFSVAGKYQNRDNGWGVNVFTGNPILTQKDISLRGKLLANLGERTSIMLSGDYSHTDSANPGFRPLTRNVRGNFAAGTIRDTDADIDPSLEAEQYGGSVEIKHDFGDVELKSLSAYRYSTLHVVFDPDGTTENEWTFVPNANLPPIGFGHGFVIDNLQHDKQFTQEIQLLSTGSGPFQWVLGGFYMWAEGDYSPAKLTTAALRTFGTFINLDVSQSLHSIAGFAQGSYQLTDATNLTAGVRFTSDKRENVGIRQTFITATGTPTATQTPPLGVVETFAKTYPRATWRLSLDHRFSPEVMGYASYNRGFRSAAYVANNVGVATPLTNKVLNPEIIDAFEIGLKTDLFDRRLRFNIAAYYYDQKNIQVMQIANGIQTIYNADGAELYGIDADFTAKLARGFTLYGGFNYVHGRYKNFTNAVISTPLPAGGNLLTVGDASGNPLQNTPEWTSNIGASYEVGDFTLAGNWYHNSGWAADPDDRLRQPAYDLLDASLTWNVSDTGLRVSVWGRNLANKFYFQQLGASNFADNGVQAAPRTYGASVGYKF